MVVLLSTVFCCFQSRLQRWLSCCWCRQCCHWQFFDMARKWGSLPLRNFSCWHFDCPAFFISKHLISCFACTFVVTFYFSAHQLENFFWLSWRTIPTLTFCVALKTNLMWWIIWKVSDKQTCIRININFFCTISSWFILCFERDHFCSVLGFNIHELKIACFRGVSCHGGALPWGCIKTCSSVFFAVNHKTIISGAMTNYTTLDCLSTQLGQHSCWRRGEFIQWMHIDSRDGMMLIEFCHKRPLAMEWKYFTFGAESNTFQVKNTSMIVNWRMF